MDLIPADDPIAFTSYELTKARIATATRTAEYPASRDVDGCPRGWNLQVNSKDFGSSPKTPDAPRGKLGPPPWLARRASSSPVNNNAELKPPSIRTTLTNISLNQLLLSNQSTRGDRIES